MSSQVKATEKKMPVWEVQCGTTHTVAAWTKGEARAKVKRKLGLERLPVGTVVSRQ